MWVKTSERLPGESGEITARNSEGEMHIYCFDAESGEFRPKFGGTAEKITEWHEIEYPKKINTAVFDMNIPCHNCEREDNHSCNDWDKCERFMRMLSGMLGKIDGE